MHAAIEACEPDDAEAANGTSVGKEDGKGVDADEEEQARQTVQLLLAEGAIWNDLDEKGETAGCIAWRLGMKGVYGVVVDAGVRYVFLLHSAKYGEMQG